MNIRANAHFLLFNIKLKNPLTKTKFFHFFLENFIGQENIYGLNKCNYLYLYYDKLIGAFYRV
ncbi:hypothetical protein SELR_03580 [Selenomonas ruminantium subsp. lactilytica TAM6421]|uniref:Uncharacterized protein n=1 Tax=Selenomonas ruminantium subsp. lactilytica (strain NBRC 103574 / TAM6421) TaxID=927704 RepID=I0GMS9_SELRL|nr:hypothetical protein SELR_03580 [Selenomonas ruminantium subsp. lactilytica TAM6421]